MDYELLNKTFDRFDSSYEREKIINTAKYDRKTYIGVKEHPQLCRFCNKESPNVNFKTDAHLIPRFLGSKYLLSYFECDECNSQFKLFENDLANFIGPIRSIVGITGKSKNPKYSKKELIIRQGEDDVVKVISPEIVEDIKKGDRQISIPAIKDNYVPSNAYKALLKIALCLIKDNETPNFEEAFRFLKYGNNQIHQRIKNSMNIIRVFVPGPPIANTPVVSLFKRKNIEIKLPEKILVMHVKNLTYQVALPLNKNDYHLADITMDIPMYPIIRSKRAIEEYGDLQFKAINLSSDITVKSEDSSIGIKISHMKKNTFANKRS